MPSPVEFLPASSPAELATRVGSTNQLARLGSDFEPGLADNATVEGSALRMNPDWQPAASGSRDFAYALYSFNLTEYSGAEAIELIWDTAVPDPATVWLALGNWPAGRWDWYPGTADGVYDLSVAGYADYIEAGTGRMLLAVVLLGTEEAVLNLLTVGEIAPEPVEITGVTPSPAVGYTGQLRGFGVEFTGTTDLTTTFSWDFDGGAVPDNSIEQNPTVTLGAPGTYDCTVAVDNGYGPPDDYGFILTVTNAQGDWPMDGRDRRHTRLSSFNGPQVSDIAWSYGTKYHIESSPATAADGTIYFIGAGYKLHALNPDGTRKWRYTETAFSETSPAVLGNGWITYGTVLGGQVAVDTDGYNAWTGLGMVECYSPVVGDNGITYLGSTMGLLAVGDYGSWQWTFDTGANVVSTPAVGDDGTIYATCLDRMLYAVDTDGEQIWAYPAGAGIASSPSIAPDGTIYFGCNDGNVYAVDSDGGLKWTYPTGDAVQSSPALGADGTVYIGSDDGNLYALSPSGGLEWSAAIGAEGKTSPAVGADGVIYMGGGNTVYAFEPDGDLLWSTELHDTITNSPVINAEGNLLVGCNNGRLYCVGEAPVNEPPVADLVARWPFILVNTSTVLDASGSTDSEGSIREYHFDFDDGTAPRIVSISDEPHIYTESGIYHPEVRVWDEAGFSDTASVTIRVSEYFSDLASPWPMMNRDYRHTGFSMHVNGPQTNNLAWSYDSGHFIYSSPVIGVDGSIYFTNNNHKLHAVNPDGTENWTLELGGTNSYSTAAVGMNGTVYIGSMTGGLFAVLPDGTVDWTFNAGSAIFSAILTYQSSIYFGTADGTVYCLSQDGSEVWSYSTGAAIWSSPAIDKDGRIFIGSDDYSLHCIDDSGAGVWTFPTGDFISSSPSIGPDGTVYIGSGDGKLYALDPDGNELWSYSMGAIRSTPTIGFDGVIYVGSDDNYVYAINSDGNLKWSFETGDQIWRSAVAIGSDGVLYVGSEDHRIYAINPDGTELWSYETGNKIRSSPAIGLDGTLYVGSYDGKLYAIKDGVHSMGGGGDL